MSHDTHPDELNLARLAFGDPVPASVTEHVAGCPECSELVAGLNDVPHLEVHSLDLAIDGRSSRPRPEALWRTAWDQVVQLVAVLKVDGDADRVTCVPVVDEIEGPAVPVPVRTLAWGPSIPNVEPVELPIRVFDVEVGAVTDLLTQLRRLPRFDLEDDDAAFDRDVAGIREALAHLRELATAHWIPATAADQPRLADQFSKPSDLATALGITPGEAGQLLLGVRQLTEDERQRLADHFGLDQVAHTVDPDLVWAVDQPEVRPLWRRYAEVKGARDSAEFRWQTVTNNEFAIAARTTAAADTRAQYLARVRAVLDART